MEAAGSLVGLDGPEEKTIEKSVSSTYVGRERRTTGLMYNCCAFLA